MDKNKMIKSLIEMSASFEEADRIISELTPCKDKDVGAKLSYLYGMFDVSIVGASNGSEDNEESLLVDYEAVLKAIINKKWR